jgi:hypothetical protein
VVFAMPRKSGRLGGMAGSVVKYVSNLFKYYLISNYILNLLYYINSISIITLYSYSNEYLYYYL